MNINLEQPWMLVLIPLGILLVWKLISQKSSIGYPNITDFEGTTVNASLILFVERLLLSVFVIACTLILARPVQFIKTSVEVYSQARDITIAFDNSSSMQSDEKMETAIQVISEFVGGRPQDRIALFVFDTNAYLEWPLSLDHETLIYRLNHLNNGGGTNISTGIIAGLEHQRRFGLNPGALVVVSDGASEVTPEEARDIESALGETKLYWIWIKSGTDNQLALEFESYVISLGGKVYRGEIEELDEILAEISKLETSPVILDQQVTTVYRFGILPLLAFICLLGAGVIEIFREV